MSLRALSYSDSHSSPGWGSTWTLCFVPYSVTFLCSRRVEVGVHIQLAGSLLLKFKAAVINTIYIDTGSNKYMCNVKVATHIDKPTENYHPVIQFLSSLLRFLTFFGSFSLVYINCSQPAGENCNWVETNRANRRENIVLRFLFLAIFTIR